MISKKTQLQTNRPKRFKKCKYCQEKAIPYGEMRKFCFKNKCIQAHNQATRLTQKRTAKKILRNNDKSALRNDCKDIANKIGKLQCFLRGEVYCVTCGATNCKFDGGHFLHASTHSAIRYVTKQINPQCVNCNQYNGGRYKEYKVYMTNRYGTDYVSWLESQNGVTKKFTLQYLQKFKRVMGKKARVLEKRLKAMM